MQTIVEYRIIWASTSDELQEEVNKLILKELWQPLGGLAFQWDEYNGSRYLQALAKYSNA